MGGSRSAGRDARKSLRRLCVWHWFRRWEVVSCPLAWPGRRIVGQRSDSGLRIARPIEISLWRFRDIHCQLFGSARNLVIDKLVSTSTIFVGKHEPLRSMAMPFWLLP